MLALQPSSNDFWFLPLGGTGEIGMNLNLYGHNGQWLMVDCGITFEDHVDAEGFTQTRVEMPAIEAIRSNQINLVGIIVTHAHEDHLGALPHLWDQLGCPIYTTPFTRNVLQNKFARSHCVAPIETVEPGSSLEIGPFSLTLVSMTHSTPETQGLVIETPVGKVFHTADWKLDPDPVVGSPMAETTFLALKDIDAVVCDSTNAPRAERAVSEAAVQAGLLAAIQDAPGRVVVACFASNIARLQTLGKVAHATQRHLGLLGYSMDNMSQCAKSAGYLTEHFAPIEASDMGYLPANEVLVVATGSQGEPGAALHKLSIDSHPDVNLAAGDLVVLSAKTIPGNEKSVARMIERFTEMGVDVLQADTSNLLLHASGHGGAPELDQLYRWINPRAVVPVHGESLHLAANAEIARQAGIEHQLVGKNGDLYDLRNLSVTAGAVTVGRLTLDAHGQLIPVSGLAD